MLKEIGLRLSTVHFKLNLLKLLEKYLKLKKPSLTLNFFKNCFTSIKETCKESGTEFKQVKFCNLKSR